MEQSNQTLVNNSSVLPAYFPKVSVRQSLTLSIILATILSMVVAWFLVDSSPIWSFIPESGVRYLTNPLCLIILFVFLVLLIYAAFQYMGVQLDSFYIENCYPLQHSQVKKIRINPKWQIVCFISGRSENKLAHTEDILSKHEFQIRKSLTPLQFGIWVLPLLGFIGTVIGISEAIAGLHPLVGTAGETSTIFTQSIGRVLAGLETAFDTTLLGLLCVIPTMMINMSLKLHGNKMNLMLGEQINKQNSLRK
jgi:hypothetical protein